MRAEGVLTFLSGLAAGMLVLLIGHELWPWSEDPDLRQYVAVRDFARESFVREITDEELLDNALHGMLVELDPYSRYYDDEESRELARETEGRYRGIGAVFSSPVEGGLLLYPLPNSPAMRAGMRVGDQILELDGKPLESYGEARFRRALAAKKSGSVRIRVRGLDGLERSLVVIPGSIVDPSVRHTRILDKERGIGYLAITSFSNETDVEFGAAVEFLERRGMRALIMDLRHDFGGTLESAVSVARRFIPSGTIVTTEGRGDPVVYLADPDAAHLAGLPTVVLVDGDTASASEVLAGALQDHRVAAIVGEPTFGKGMVQAIRTFGEFGSRAKVTTSYYYSPTHRNFERSADPGRDYGILPDLDVPLLADERQRVHSFLRSYSPGLEVLPALEAWSRVTGEEKVPPMPVDWQLRSALDLLAGKRPGPEPQPR